MDFASLIMMIVVLLALIGVLVFLIWDYMKFKTDTADNLVKASETVTNEKTERLANMKYIVDQVNTVNTDIYNTFSSNMTLYNNKVSDVSSSNITLTNSLQSVFGFKVEGADKRILELPGGVTPDLQLISNVTAISGMNISQLTSNVNTQFCSAIDSDRCIKFPDSNGDTYITSLYPNKQVVIDGNTVFRDKISYASADGSKTYGEVSSFGTDNSDMLLKTNNNMILQATEGGIGIGRSPINPPNAMLHVNGPSGDVDIFKATSVQPGSTPVRILSDGTLVVNKIQLNDGQSDPIWIFQNPQNKELVINSQTGVNIKTGAKKTTFENQVVYTVEPTLSTTTV